MSESHDTGPDATNGSHSSEVAASILRDFWAAVHHGSIDDGAPRILDAWTDGDAIAVVYESPRWTGQLLGLRRTWPPHYMNDDPGTTGEGMWAEIVEPLGETSRGLRHDARGIGWWGDLDSNLPERANAPHTDH